MKENVISLNLAQIQIYCWETMRVRALTKVVSNFSFILLFKTIGCSPTSVLSLSQYQSIKPNNRGCSHYLSILAFILISLRMLLPAVGTLEFCYYKREISAALSSSSICIRRSRSSCYYCYWVVSMTISPSLAAAASWIDLYWDDCYLCSMLAAGFVIYTKSGFSDVLAWLSSYWFWTRLSILSSWFTVASFYSSFARLLPFVVVWFICMVRRFACWLCRFEAWDPPVFFLSIVC